MLPHFVWQRFRGRDRRYEARTVRFRRRTGSAALGVPFPGSARSQYDDVGLELRQALEPWNVLGEEGAAGGTVRYVDCSVERLEVKVSGLTGGPPHRTCNGRRGAAAPKPARAGEAVAGVRFKAWQPPLACIRPSRSHAPLTFDLIDTWNGRTLGGCTYHVAHPGGRNYEIFPVNANEAEAAGWPGFGTMATRPARSMRHGNAQLIFLIHWI